jgi:hypothetical protein
VVNNTIGARENDTQWWKFTNLINSYFSLETETILEIKLIHKGWYSPGCAGLFLLKSSWCLKQEKNIVELKWLPEKKEGL